MAYLLARGFKERRRNFLKSLIKYFYLPFWKIINAVIVFLAKYFIPTVAKKTAKRFMLYVNTVDYWVTQFELGGFEIT